MTDAYASRGTFIVLEGGEGAGKTTQARRLCLALEDRGATVTLTREPGGCMGAEDIRGLLAGQEWNSDAEALLHYAARAEHLARVIRPALARGHVVLCDRFADSTDAYQGAGMGTDRWLLGKLRQAIVRDDEPDVVIVLDLPPAEGMRRLAGRVPASSIARYERLDDAFHQWVRRHFLRLAADRPDRYVLVDATRPEDEVFADVWKTVRQRLDGESEAS